MIHSSIIAIIIIIFCVSHSYTKDYESALEKSMLFYQAQRSGRLGPDNKISWRMDAHVNDQGTDGEDLSGKK